MRSLAEHLDAPVLGDSDLVGGDGAVEGCAGGSCGVLARYALVVDHAGVITECAARVRGRAAAFATASALCEGARGKTVIEAAALGLGSLHPSFAAMSEDDRERALVAEDGFHHAIGQWFLREMSVAAGHARGDRAMRGAPEVLVAMSGGVDSAVALHSEHERTGSTAGVTLRLWIDPRAPDPEAACCAPGSVRRARATCHALGVPHVSLDLRRAFAARVVAPFVAGYQAGRTPNPCVGCNGDFRLEELVHLADVLGVSRVATGHYVRSAVRGDTVLVQRGVDDTKDQSYMLSTLDPELVARFRFPLGHLRKDAVRARAAELGLEQATIAESQEVCFLGGGDYRGFLERAGAMGTAGDIVTEQGEVLGTHGGVAGFTPGQRRGVGGRRLKAEHGLGSFTPLYVMRTEPATGSVVVGPRARLDAHVVELEDVRAWDGAPSRANVQVRYRTRQGPAPATLDWSDDRTRLRIRFDEPVYAPAPGQVACLYDDAGVVVGAGTIVRAMEVGEPDR